MLISTKGRYALRVLIDLATNQSDRYLPLKEIAERQQISEKYLESILKTLVQNKILTGLRGKGGGYRLSISPEELQVGTVLRLTEASLATVGCLEENAEPCPRKCSCPTLPLWRNLNELVNNYLNSVTLHDLLEQTDALNCISAYTGSDT